MLLRLDVSVIETDRTQAEHCVHS